jgi:hypothetical protein
LEASEYYRPNQKDRDHAKHGETGGDDHSKDNNKYGDMMAEQVRQARVGYYIASDGRGMLTAIRSPAQVSTICLLVV